MDYEALSQSRRRRVLAGSLATVAVVAIAAAVWTASVGSRLPSAPEGSGMVVGRSYALGVYAHCGLQSVTFDGRLWEARPRVDERNARAMPEFRRDGFERVVGRVRLTDRNHAEFRGADGRLITRFEPILRDNTGCA